MKKKKIIMKCNGTEEGSVFGHTLYIPYLNWT